MRTVEEVGGICSVLQNTSSYLTLGRFRKNGAFMKKVSHLFSE